jgi:hypothetical protein
MAAGLGFKTFATNDVLSAADTNGYLMQGVLVFASAAARDSAITSPQEGQFAYLKDTNVTMYYTGSAWANLDTTGMTNPMTTTGDTIYSSSGSTPARLGIGSTGQVMTVAGGVPTWATPAGGGGKLLQLVNNTYSTNFATTSTSYVDTGMSTTITPTSATSKVFVMYNGNHRVATAGGAVNIRILRGATQIKLYNAQLYTGTNPERGEITLTWLDSPATTSATTYKIQICNDVTSSIEAQLNNEASVLTLMEIGA